MPQSTSRIANSATERPISPAALVVAVLLHVGIIGATFVSWSHRLDIADQTPVVPVDLVTLGEKTNVAPMVKQQPKAPPKEEAQPKAPEQIQQAPAATPQEEEAVSPPPDEASSEPALQKPPPIVPKTKPKPDQKKEDFDINSIVALLDKRAPAAASAPNAKVGSRTIKGIGDQNAMTADLRAMLQSMIYKCWSPPVGAPHPEQLIVSYELFLNPDGTVAQPPQLVGNSGSPGDPYARAAIEAARRAIYTCAPYQLPADRYAQWRDVTFRFDPRDMVGQ
jgi:type IV secretory pathway VirB10-like protein